MINLLRRFKLKRKTEYVETHKLKTADINQKSTFSKMLSNIENNKTQDIEALLKLLSQEELKYFLTEMCVLEISLVNLGIITKKEANLLFNNYGLLDSCIKMAKYYNVYILFTTNKQNDIEPEIRKLLITRSLLGFLLLSLIDFGNNQNKKIVKLVNKINLQKKAFETTEQILNDMYGLQTLTAISRIDDHYFYMYYEQTTLNLFKKQNMLEVLLHPKLYSKIYLLLNKNFNYLNPYKIIKHIVPFDIGVANVNTKHPNSVNIAKIVNKINSRLIMLTCNPLPMFGEVINIDYVKARKKGLIKIDVKTLLLYHNLNGEDITNIDYVKPLIMFLIDYPEFSNYDFYIDLIDISNNACEHILEHLTINLKYINNNVKILVSGVDGSKENCIKYAKETLGFFFINTDVNPKTGERYLEEEIKKDIDRLSNKQKLDNLCSMHKSKSYPQFFPYDNEDNEESKYKNSDVKHLDKSYLNIKEDKIESILKGLHNVVNHKDYKGFVIILHGESGVGKSRLADIIANELKFTTNKVSVSDISSKWIGETEKNIKDVISNNPKKNVLLLDEVDGMIPNRESDVRHYETSATTEWLSCLDNPTGIIILTTNYKSNLDKAISRRIHLKLTLLDILPKTIETILINKAKEHGLKVDINIKATAKELKGLRIGDVGLVDKLVVYYNTTKLSQYVDRLKNEIKERSNPDKKVGLL